MLDLCSRCTPLKLCGAAMLLCLMVGYSIALHVIYRAAHTPEIATVPSPRTPWSSKRAGQIGRWLDWQSQLVEEASGYVAASPYDARARLVLLGDSITEAWRGTSYGEPRASVADVPELLQETLGRRWPSPLVLGISGDQTQHVLWRLANGEISAAMADDPRLLVVLLIGTNNLGAGHSPEEVAQGVEAIVSRLLNATRGRVLVNALFPRGDGVRVLPNICPPRCSKSGKPLKTFRPILDRANYLLNSTLASQQHAQQSARDRVRFVDCGRHFWGRVYPRPSNGGGMGGGGGGGAGGFPTAPFAGDDGRLRRPSEKLVHAAGQAVDRVVGGAERKAHELVQGATRGVNEVPPALGLDPSRPSVCPPTSADRPSSHEWQVVAVTEDYLEHGAPSDVVSTELFQPDKLHPNAMGHRQWASCLEAELFAWGVS